MGGHTVAIAFSEKRTPGAGESSLIEVSRSSAANGGTISPAGSHPRAFLRMPPFPGAKTRSFVRSGTAGAEQEDLVPLLRRLRVGGSYWAAQPQLPQKYALVRSAAAVEAARAATSDPIVLWAEETPVLPNRASLVIEGECDPWHMLSGATMLVSSMDDELCIIASMLGLPLHRFERATCTLTAVTADTGALVGKSLAAAYENPFTGDPMSALEAIELCAFWRRLIDSNRDIAGGIGFAFWKRDHVAPLLWGGTGKFHFLRDLHEPKASAPLAVWRAKVSLAQLALFHEAQVPLIEAEDGFLRSQGLGADCVPPLSITVDRLGAYFDPAQPSELEILLQDGEFDDRMLSRARRLRQVIVEAGLGKYERSSGARLERPAGERRHILVPGQVEDDRAVQCGGCGLTSNLELLARVRAEAPDAHILYKPHPDVVAGHRRGAISEAECLKHADAVITGSSIASLIDMVDEVHVNTSLAGFEALLREKPVTTHGVPFYAGWGLTRDLGPVPRRRTARRSLDELVAAALLLYPRYLDPLTGLPCPAEILVERLSGSESGHRGLIVFMRKLQGRLMRRVGSIAG